MRHLLPHHDDDNNGTSSCQPQETRVKNKTYFTKFRSVVGKGIFVAEHSDASMETMVSEGVSELEGCDS